MSAAALLQTPQKNHCHMLALLCIVVCFCFKNAVPGHLTPILVSKSWDVFCRDPCNECRLKLAGLLLDRLVSRPLLAPGLSLLGTVRKAVSVASSHHGPACRYVSKPGQTMDRGELLFAHVEGIPNFPAAPPPHLLGAGGGTLARRLDSHGLNAQNPRV